MAHFRKDIHAQIVAADQRIPGGSPDNDMGWIFHFYLVTNYFYFPNLTELCLIGPPLKLAEPRPVPGADLPVTLYPHPSGCLGLVVAEGLDRPLKGADKEAYDVPLPVAHSMAVGVERLLQAAVEVALGYEFFAGGAFGWREVALFGTHHGLTSGR
jgi:hypothetical protein